MAEKKGRWLKFGFAAVALVGFCLLGWWWLIVLPTAALQRAKLDVKNLDKAVKNYYRINGYYPPDFQSLCVRQSDGSPALVDRRVLIDPWGQPYIYDLGTIRPGQEAPLIYTQGPPGEGKFISNWPGEGKEQTRP